MKKEWANPLINNKPFFEAGNEIGAGSGQSSTDDDIPYDWEMWSVMFDECDADGDGTPGTYDDYVKWMTDRHFEDWITPGP